MPGVILIVLLVLLPAYAAPMLGLHVMLDLLTLKDSLLTVDQNTGMVDSKQQLGVPITGTFVIMSKMFA